jgi:hypothetical protein
VQWLALQLGQLIDDGGDKSPLFHPLVEDRAKSHLVRDSEAAWA